MTEHNLDQLLSRLDPVRGEDIPAPDGPRARAIRERAMRGRRSPRRLIAVAAAFLVLAGATAGAIVWLADEPSDPTVVCYESASLDADRVEGRVELGPGPAACEALWAEGVIGEGDVPPLVPCVLDSGAIGVFPGTEETCERLGLAVAVDIERSVAPAQQLRERLFDALVVDPCVGPDDGAAIAADLLDELGLAAEGWTVERITPQIDEPLVCATSSVDTPRRVVVITATPDFTD